MSRSLPDFPSLEYLKKRAKEGLAFLRQSKPDARLSEVQHALALYYGFASWPKLKEHVVSRQETAVGGRRGRGGGNGGNIGAGVDDAPRDFGGPSGAFARYSEKARLAVFFARYRAKHDARTIGPEQILQGLLQADGDEVARLLGCNISGEQLLRGVARRITAPAVSAIEPAVSDEGRELLREVVNEADRLQNENIETGHFLLALLSTQSPSTHKILVGVLSEDGVSEEDARFNILQTLKRA